MRNSKRALICAMLAAAFVGGSLSEASGEQPGTPQLPPGVPPGIIKKEKKSAPPQAPSKPTDNVKVPAQGEMWAPKVLLKGRELHWLLTAEVSLRVPNLTDANGTPTNQMIQFQTAAVVFPILERTAGSREIRANREGELSFGGVKVDVKPDLVSGYPSGARLAKFEARNISANSMRLKVEIGMACASTTLDEALARKITWPDVWPEAAASTFRPQLWIDYLTHPGEQGPTKAEIKKYVDKWLDNKDPKSMPPVEVAKRLFGKVVEDVRLSGEGLNFTRSGLFEGFDLKGALKTLQDSVGSEHDMVCALVAVYRTAGLPARVVIGMDSSEGDVAKPARGQYSKKIHSWAEFALVDPANGKEFWIPVDPQRQRNNSSKAPKLDAAWRFFGNNKDLGNFIPIAHHYHPPTSVVAHGSPCMWGWITTPTAQLVDQSVRFGVSSRPRRSGDDPEGEDKK